MSYNKPHSAVFMQKNAEKAAQNVTLNYSLGPSLMDGAVIVSYLPPFEFQPVRCWNIEN